MPPFYWLPLCTNICTVSRKPFKLIKSDVANYRKAHLHVFELAFAVLFRDHQDQANQPEALLWRLECNSSALCKFPERMAMFVSPCDS